MNEKTVSVAVSSKIKLVRVDLQYTQEEMANMIGISKKTLIQIEKRRQVANWSIVVTFVSLFNDHPIVQHALGEFNPIELIQLITRDEINFENKEVNPNVMYWNHIKEKQGYRLEQNHLNQTYRVVDQNLKLFYRSINYENTKRYFANLMTHNYR
ncbi:helix-turn-helix transcriptional regulator [Halalkalibacillus halophilus]|uniref:helix-turn-helix transcriptional regulator n=1 Tax=Halalkalibacillus halophilus TaxID=392827 RepID=UPI000417DBA7|nr:transcriptional regulator [Halalkalibacillus halophilus]